MMMVRGARVRTLVALEADAAGLEGRSDLTLAAGTCAVIHETPATNSGFYSILVGSSTLYDVDASEIAVAPDEDADGGVCAACSAPAAHRCSRCRAAFYCSRACQAADWKSHRPTCAARCARAGSGLERPRGGEDEHERAWLAAAQAWLGALRDSDRRGLEGALRAFGAALAAAPAMTATSPRAELLARRHLFYGVSLLDASECEPPSSSGGGAQRASALAQLRRAAELAPASAEAALELSLALERHGALAEARAHARAAVARGVLWRDEWQRPGTMVPALSAAAPRAVWDATQFGWVVQLEAHSAQILAELHALGPPHGEAETVDGAWQPVGGAHRPTGQHDGSVVASGGWAEAVLLGRGAQPELAPRTVALLRAHAPSEVVDLCERGAGEVIVSALAPRTHIRAHCAPTNARLTAHLGLRVPPEGSGRCELRVGAHTLRWAEGRALVFDDSFEHEVFNLTDHTRVVLLVRFWHPLLATRAQRDEALRASEWCTQLGERLRHVPPLAAGCERLWRWVCGLEACASCGLAAGAGVGLVFGDDAREASRGQNAPVVGICACGAVCSPDRMGADISWRDEH